MRRIAILCLGAVACAAAAGRPGLGSGPARRHRRARSTRTRPRTPSGSSGPRRTGADAYRIRFDYYENNTLKASPVVNYPTPNSGSNWANWSGVATLQHGGQYGVCAQGQYSFPNDSLFFPDGPNSCSMGTMLGRRAYTTIDRSKPTAALQLAAGAAFVKDTKIPLRIDFADDVAGPFPANFLCFQVGGGPTTSATRAPATIYGYNAACSVPGERRQVDHVHLHGRLRRDPGRERVGLRDRGRRRRSRTTRTAPTRAPRRTRPTCPTRAATAWCVDRTPPTVAIGVASASVKVGDLVSLQASASDATSGLAGAGQWTWGDNTGGGSGDAVTHTYTQPGTYEVALTVTDAAGNAATAKKAITVTAGGGGDDHAARHGRRHDDDAADPAAGGDDAAARRRRRRARPRSSVDAPAQRPRSRQVDPRGAHGQRRGPRPAHARPRRRA